MPMHIKGGFKSKNGLVTYGEGGTKKKAKRTNPEA